MEKGLMVLNNYDGTFSIGNTTWKLGEDGRWKRKIAGVWEDGNYLNDYIAALDAQAYLPTETDGVYKRGRSNKLYGRIPQQNGGYMYIPQGNISGATWNSGKRKWEYKGYVHVYNPTTKGFVWKKVTPASTPITTKTTE